MFTIFALSIELKIQASELMERMSVDEFIYYCAFYKLRQERMKHGD